jgi:UDP-glucose 4-epimerase
VRFCVTGGAGFIGSNLVDRLLADGHAVVVLDNLATGSRDNLAGVLGRIEFIEGDLRDRAAVAQAVRGADAVFHQAALASVARSVASPREVSDVNVGGTLNLLMAAREAGVRRLVFASSSSVYGDTPTLPKVETMPISPRSPYAASKAAGEAYLAAFDAAYGLETVSFRYFNVYGPRQSARSQYAAVVPSFVESMLAGKAPTIHGDGGQTRDFTFVGDVVDALVLAATGSAPGSAPINLGAGGRTSILDLAKVVAKATGFGGSPRFEATRPGDVRDSLADVGRARERLGWTPKTPLAAGIERLVEWTRKQGSAAPAART